MTFLARILSALGFQRRTAGDDQHFGWVPILSDGSSAALTKPVAQSTWVMRAIKLISGPISAVPLRFMRGADKSDFSDPSLVAFWDSPAAGMDLSDLIEAFVGWMKMKGEFFIVLDDSWLVPFPKVVERWPQFIVARPDRMREVVKGNTLQGWLYTDGSGAQHPLLAKQVLQLRYWNPYDDWRGLAEYDAAQLAAETDYLNQRFAKNLGAANGDTGPIVSPVGSAGLSKDQVTQITLQLEAKRRAQLRGEFLPAFLNGEIKIEDSKIRAPDSSFQTERIIDREQIAVAFGVPPSMFTVQASYSIGSASDYFRLIETACQPLASKLAAAIGRLSSRMTGQDLRAEFDLNKHSTMQAVRNERLAGAVQLWDRGMSWEKLNEYLSLGMPEFEGWDRGYVNFGLQAVGSEPSVPPTENPDFAEEPEDNGSEEPIEEARSALRGRKWKRLLARPAGEPNESDGCLCCCSPTDLPPIDPDVSPEARAEEERKRAQWSAYMARRVKVIRAFHSKFSKLLFEARAEVLAKITAASKAGPSPVIRAAAADFMFDFKKWRIRFVAQMRKVAAAALQEAGNQLYEELDADDPWAMPMPEAMAFLQERENKLGDVAQDVFDRIRGAIETGIENGYSMSDIAAAIRAKANEINEGRARVIAQTETAVAYGVGRQRAMSSLGVQYKSWLSSRNKSVRASHRQADMVYSATPIPLDEPFQIGGFALMHPGDPNGPPQEVINCHCVQIAVAPQKEESVP